MVDENKQLWDVYVEVVDRDFKTHKRNYTVKAGDNKEATDKVLGKIEKAYPGYPESHLEEADLVA